MLENEGLLWNGRDLRNLHRYVIRCYSLEHIAAKLGRTQSACKSRIRIIRTCILFYTGSASQTLKDIKVEVNK